jgi:hypothetical protein
MFRKEALNEEEKGVMEHKLEMIKEREDNIKQQMSDKNSARKDLFVVDVAKSWNAIDSYKRLPVSFHKVVILLN